MIVPSDPGPVKNKARRPYNILCILLIGALNIFPPFSYALKQKIEFDRFSIEEGLSQSSVNCILRDQRGWMWFGTQDGLNRYDGYTFTTYQHQPKKPGSLSSSYIYSIYQDREGILWVGTRDGLNQWDIEKDSFLHFKKDKPQPYKISDNEITALVEDREDALWVGTAAGGLNKYDLKENKFVFYQHDISDPDSLSSDHITTLYIDSSGDLWIGTQDKGLDRWDKKKNKFLHYPYQTNDPKSLSGHYVTAVGSDREGNLWIGTFEGLNKLDPNTGTFTRYKHSPRDPGSISSNEIFCIGLDQEEELLIGTSEGLNQFNPKSNTFSHWFNDPPNNYSLSNNIIRVIYKDSSQILWIGTDGGGFNKYSPYRDRFAHYYVDPHHPHQGLSGNMVYAIYEDHKGIVWIGTNQGLNSFDRQSETFLYYKSEPANSRGLSDNYVFSIGEDRTGVLWVGTWGGGLNEFNRKDGTFTYYRSDPHNEFSLSNDIVRVIYKDRSGILWIGTEGGGLNQMDGEKKTFHRYQADERTTKSISSNYIRAIVEDAAGILWIGTKYGLNRFERNSDTFRCYTTDANETNCLSHNEINAIYPEPSGTLWVGTSGGLNRLEPKSGQFTFFGEAEGLPNNVVSGIAADNYGNLWISTNKGISRFDPRRGSFRNYGIKDGLQSNEFNQGAFFKTRSGEMLFGGIKGLNRFNPALIIDNPFRPPIIITDLKIFHKSAVVRTSPSPMSISENTEIQLSYRDRVLTFEYAALDFTSPPANNYAYMLEGLDRDWIAAGTRRFASYTTLPPGKYIFKVKGTNSDGIWNETGTSLRIAVMPPFWKTWWFRGFTVITLLVLIFIGYQVRTFGIRERAKKLQEINEALNREITERKQAEEQAQKSERRLRTFLETASEGFLEIDNQNLILDINPEMCAILGRSRETLLGNDFLDFINPPDTQKFLNNKNPKTGAHSTYNLTLLQPGDIPAYCLVKTASLLDENRDIKGAFAMVTNITEIVQAEEELKQTKKYLDNVFNSLSSMLISVDHKGVITQWNTAAENYIGVPAQVAISREVWEIIPFLKPYQDELTEVFHARVPVELRRECVNIGKGEPKYLDIIIYPLLYEGLEGSVIRLDDVTEAEKKDRQLLQAQKMETVGNLAGGLAHDFNNVLGGIIGTVSLIKYLLEKEKKVSLEKLRNSINTIEKGASRAVDLVNQLLTLSRKNEPLFAPVDLNEVLNDVIKICENTFEKSIKLDISYHADKAIIWADATQVQQVLLNLFINASHAMTLMRKMDEPQGGTLSVSIVPFYADSQFCMSQPEAETGNYWVLTAADTGVGIDPADISKIFDPFFTTKTKAQGTGLGLAMTYNIVQQHSGFIDVDSQLGRGTSFRVYFPQKEEQKFFFKQFLPTEPLTRGAGLILVVDDEESLRFTLKEILEACGYSVLLAEDGRQGLHLFKEKCNEIQLIILDLAMPNLAGKESFLEIKKLYPPAKVLLISGFKHDQRIKDIIESGVNGFLPKPFTMVELSKKVSEILRK